MNMLGWIKTLKLKALNMHSAYLHPARRCVFKPKFALRGGMDVKYQPGSATHIRISVGLVLKLIFPIPPGIPRIM